MNENYNKCKAFINLPRTAGFNLSWLEAMAAGIPIVIGNWKGAGTFLPIDKLSNKENKVKKAIEIIQAQKKTDYRNWLIKNKFSWNDKSKELIKFLEESRSKK